MKKTALFSILIVLLTIILPACQESEYADWKILNEKWLDAHKNDSGFVTSPSGLRYKIVHPGWHLDRKPNVNSDVKVNYKGTLVDGSVFDQNSGAWFSLSSVVRGWREALPKINDGGSIILHIPSKLGYDTVSTNKKIPPHSTLIFEIDLIESEN